MKRLLLIIAILFCATKANAQAPAFQAISALASSTGVDVTVTLPAHIANDVLLLQCWVRDVDDTATVSGWTQFTGSPFDRSTVERYWQFWLRATGSAETNPLFDKDTTTGDTACAVTTYRGAKTTGDPWEVVGAATTGTADPAVVTGITALTDNSLIVVPLGYADNNNASIITTGTDPTAYTEHYLEDTTGDDVAVTFSEGAQTTAAATGDVSVNFNTGVTAGDGWGARVLALLPEPCNDSTQVCYDNSANARSTGTPSSLTYSLTVGSGNNRALAVFAGIGCSGGSTARLVTGVTYNSVALEQVVHEIPDPARYVDLWALPAGTEPDSGAHNVVVTMSDVLNCGNIESGAIAASGVDQTTVFTSTDGNSGTGVTASATLASSGANDMGIHGECAGSTMTTTPETSLWSDGTSTLQCDAFAGARAVGGDVDFARTISASDTWVMVGAAFKKFSAAGAAAGFNKLQKLEKFGVLNQ